jgi:hypothetical protein
MPFQETRVQIAFDDLASTIVLPRYRKPIESRNEVETGLDVVASNIDHFLPRRSVVQYLRAVV